MTAASVRMGSQAEPGSPAAGASPAPCEPGLHPTDVTPEAQP